MSIIYSSDDQVTIEIPFPKEKVNHYLKKINQTSWDDLKLYDKEKIFLLSIADFKIGKLSLDEMSEIAGDLWDSLGTHRTGDLADALYACGELNFYVRYITKEKPGMFNNFIIETFEFYEKNKHKIK